MRIFLTGISCVGKTTIGARLANLLDYPFFDLDEEIENYFGTSIERLQNKFMTMYSFRQEASKALIHILSQKASEHCVIALPPSGLMDNYWQVVKKAEGVIVVLTDKPEHILQRLTFYDLDSRPIEKHLTEKEKKLYLREIKKDFTYFKRTYVRANFSVDIEGLGPDQAAVKILETLKIISHKETKIK